METSIRSLVSNSIRKMRYIKESHTIEIIGCSFEDLKRYIEDKFVLGMCLDNYGEWHIDHIIPISYAKDKEDILRLNHYSNLQPLWSIDNMVKGNRWIG